jgi:hypothetical protein
VDTAQQAHTVDHRSRAHHDRIVSRRTLSRSPRVPLPALNTPERAVSTPSVDEGPDTPIFESQQRRGRRSAPTQVSPSRTARDAVPAPPTTNRTATRAVQLRLHRERSEPREAGRTCLRTLMRVESNAVSARGIGGDVVRGSS